MLKWLKIIRPQSLFASMCPVVVAWMMVVAPSPWGAGWNSDIVTGIITILCALSLQILSNLINDYYDYVRGADKENRVGFHRPLADGSVTLRQMRNACLITLVVSVALGAYLIWVGGWIILLIGLLSIFFAWLYTATSYSLSYLGIADVFVLLFYGLIAGWGTAWLLMGENLLSASNHFMLRLLAATAVNGLWSMCVLMTNNLRDMEDDEAVGKRTFPVRFGKRAGEIMMGIVVALMPIMAYMATGSWVATLVLIPGLVVYTMTLRAKGTDYNNCLVAAGLSNVVYTILMAIKLYV